MFLLTWLHGNIGKQLTRFTFRKGTFSEVSVRHLLKNSNLFVDPHMAQTAIIFFKTMMLISNPGARSVSPCEDTVPICCLSSSLVCLLERNICLATNSHMLCFPLS